MNQLTKQVFIVNGAQETADPNRVSERVSFFDEAGNALEVGGGSAPAISVGSRYAVSHEVTGSVLQSNPIDLSDFDFDDDTWYDESDDVLYLPTGLFSIEVSGLTLSGAGLAALVDSGFNVVMSRPDIPRYDVFPMSPLNEVPVIDGSKIIYVPELTSVTFTWERWGTDALNVYLDLQVTQLS